MTDSSEIACVLNEYFCSGFTSDNGSDIELISISDLPRIDNIHIEEDGVFSLLLKLDDKKSSGIDNIPTAFLVRYAEWCSKYLNLILHESLARAVHPRDWHPHPPPCQNNSHTKKGKPVHAIRVQTYIAVMCMC